MVCAIDCGSIVNPATIEVPILRINEMPIIEVYIAPSREYRAA